MDEKSARASIVTCRHAHHIVSEWQKYVKNTGGLDKKELCWDCENYDNNSIILHRCVCVPSPFTDVIPPTFENFLLELNSGWIRDKFNIN